MLTGPFTVPKQRGVGLALLGAVCDVARGQGLFYQKKCRKGVKGSLNL